MIPITFKRMKSHLRALLVSCFGVCLLGAELEAGQPNVLLILADDLGYGDVGYQGSDVATPHIDSIAKSGVQFTDAYVTCPVCAPSRAGLLTGRHQQRFGFWDNIGPFRVNKEVKPGVPLDLPILPERLKKLGYVTGAFGKMHGGEEEEMMPWNRWDEFYGFNNGASNFIDSMNRKHNPVFHNDKIVTKFYSDRGVRNDEVSKKGVLVKDADEYQTWKLGEMAMKFIEANKDQPFFCYLPYSAVHGPFQAPKEIFDKYKHEKNHERRLVMAMLDAMDQSIGQVLDCLKKNDLFDNTIIIFLSDNGGHQASLNGELRGKKGTYWEGGLRVPYCMSWKGEIDPGLVYKKPVSSLDLMPTLIAAAGGEVEESWGLDGVDLMPYLTGKKKGRPHEVLYWSWGNRKAIRSGDMKLLSMDDGRSFKLFDLANDISENKDVARQYPEMVASMKKLHSAWESELSPQLWGWNSKLGYRDPLFGKPKPYHFQSEGE